MRTTNLAERTPARSSRWACAASPKRHGTARAQPCHDVRVGLDHDVADPERVERLPHRAPDPAEAAEHHVSLQVAVGRRRMGRGTRRHDAHPRGQGADEECVEQDGHERRRERRAVHLVADVTGAPRRLDEDEGELADLGQSRADPERRGEGIPEQPPVQMRSFPMMTRATITPSSDGLEKSCPGSTSVSMMTKNMATKVSRSGSRRARVS